MPMTLTDALGIFDFSERRKALRTIAGRVMETWSKENISRAFTNSPLVGDASNQINPRPTVTGLRDSLDLDTLVGIACGELSQTCVLNAIMHPTEEGAISESSKTGYVFGRPDRWDEATAKRFIDKHKSLTPTEEPMSVNIDDFGLQDLTDLHDLIVSTLGDTSDDALSLMDEHFSGHERLRPLTDLMSSRDNITEPTEPSIQVQKAFDAIVKMRDGHVAEACGAVSIPTKPDGAQANLIDLALTQAGLPSISTLIDTMSDLSKRAEEAAKRAATSVVAPVASEYTGDGTIPNGRVTIQKASDVFGITGAGKAHFDFDVPVWDWDAQHPHVPQADADYVFRPMSLFRVLYALITNQPAYLHGHTGSGKTTLIEQVAARLQWPFMRVNFDSEITRMDLVGRDVLTQEGGTTVSKFVDGILPQMMSGPYIGCFDELDFIRPDIAYVMQRAFEGNGLMLTEDGGRVVAPNKMFRMFATGNTVGQGDEFGMYQGARPQSMALLDRFKVWVHVEYMDDKQRDELLKSRVPSLSADMRRKVNKYVTEHIEAFTTSKVMQPISPRGYLALGEAIATFTQLFPATDAKLGVEQAIETVILDRCSAQDKAVLNGIVNRVFSI